MVEQAYRIGAFPMADPLTGEIAWYAPDPRAILPLDGFCVPRSLRSLVRRRVYEVRWNTAFGDVIRSCAERTETWISPEIIEAYEALHRAGKAHSVEAWKDDRLAGGLYGVSLGGAFFGESMFSQQRDASTVALSALVRRMQERGARLLDIQFVTPHLRRFGAVEIPRAAYLRRLRTALAIDAVLLP
ncbi:MAG: leucyl/phenylalanyl-tRNA--protein transferase [Bacteroidetes bacterium]|jgi:leucyl/phenylalanyl-tRNA--protein transferase|nr:leucyl/phenylalanyl-tRNA--protein transferase [Bacteroidota bacterium]